MVFSALIIVTIIVVVALLALEPRWSAKRRSRRARAASRAERLLEEAYQARLHGRQANHLECDIAAQPGDAG